MTYADQWKILSSRILGLMRAGELHARFLSIRSNTSLSRTTQLHQQCKNVFSALDDYGRSYKDSLPKAATDRINEFINKNKLLGETKGTPELNDERVWDALVVLGAYETEMTFILSDSQEHIRARSERALAHLQRMLVADTEFREKWRKAFMNGEVACEKLGAVHLLYHGIFAFKINGEGERTDLVFPELIGSLVEGQRYSDGMVLTEWKKATNADDAGEKFNAALAQAKRYAQGVLGGSELTTYRYLVVVSENQITVPPDKIEDAVTYRHINIAVTPSTPSRTK